MKSAHPERGAALVTAIFLLVVLAAVGAYMLSVAGVQQSTTNRALLSARAHYAARAGIDWGIHRARNAADTMCPVSPAVSTTSFTLTGSGFDGFNIAVGCMRTNHSGTALNEVTGGVAGVRPTSAFSFLPVPRPTAIPAIWSTSNGRSRQLYPTATRKHYKHGLAGLGRPPN